MNVHELQKQFKEKYGILKGKWDTILSTIPLNFQQISKPIKDLMLMETIQDSTRVIAEAYNYPMYLLGFSEGTTFNNVSEARRSLYEEAVIPEAMGFCSFINSELGIEGEEFKLRVTISDVDALNEGKKIRADATKIQYDTYYPMYQNNLITLNEFYSKIGLETVEGGDVKINEGKKIPLASVIGVGGTQSLQQILADPNLTLNQKKNILIQLFGFDETVAESMTNP
jgi:hypothetical protein